MTRDERATTDERTDLSDQELEQELTLAAIASYRAQRFSELLEEHLRRRALASERRPG